MELDVTLPEGSCRALAYPPLVGRPEPGDTVLLNTTALAMGLGTGGYAMVVAVPDRLPEDPQGPGHLVKARYTPLQATVLGADEQDSPHHETLREADSVDGMPVVVADLHSALPAILCGLYGSHPERAPETRAPAARTDGPRPRTAPEADGPRPEVAREVDGPRQEVSREVDGSRQEVADPRPEGGAQGTDGSREDPASARRPLRVAYVMLDGGALPAWFSMSAARLRELGWLCGVVTTGQAFGGDVEAVTVHTGLLAARHVLSADVAIVTQGPGNLGTGTRWGFSGVSAGEAVNATAVLGGRPVGALRVSEGDLRARHIGVSHHSLTAYGRVALAPAQVVVPDLPGAFGERVRQQAAALGDRHELVNVPVDGLAKLLEDSPVKLSTMGRGLDRDLAGFLASAAAGRHAASLLG
ncbi:DUF3866 family protein [Sphaerisporangium sp. NPDC005288]|uniref:DUF3866 family protein n=1 Tax=Sphaerisporangium sp. NPDC005288 TaxID=3155114 RepID=UPI0033BF3906